MNAQQAIKSLLSEFTGQANFVVAPRFFITMLGGDFNAAILLNQILYWQDRTKDTNGWFYKSSKDFFEEIALSKYQIERATAKLKQIDLIETKLKKVKGAPTLHFRADQDKLHELIFLTLNEIGLSRNSTIQSLESEQSDSKESGQSLTKNTTKITSKEVIPWESFYSSWKYYLPGKTQPKPGNKTLRAKFNKRMKDKGFAENHQKAILAASKSPALVGDGWFQAAWFLKNDVNYLRVLNKEWAWKDEQIAKEQSNNKSTSEKIKER